MEVPVILREPKDSGVDVLVQRVSCVARGGICGAKKVVCEGISAVPAIETELAAVRRRVLAVKRRGPLVFEAELQGVLRVSPCDAIRDLVGGLTIARARLIVKASESENSDRRQTAQSL